MAVKQKIRSQRGATLMAALLFFLIAAVCGSIILAAATATLSRVKNQAKDAQAYYAVTSAAQLIRDDLMDSKWVLTLEEEYTSGNPVPTKTTVKEIKLAEPQTPTFVNDLIKVVPAQDVQQLVTDADIQIKASDNLLPVIYAKANSDNMKLSKANDVLKLEIALTNSHNGENGVFNTYQETDADGNQLYWVSVELHSVRVPQLDSIVSDGRENGKGKVVRTIGLTWADPVIKKVER